MESLKIVALCILASIVYGIVHDQITARVCVEYFSIFHPPILGGTQSPTMLAFGWGVIATWWVGAMLGIPLAVVAQAGSWPRFTASQLLPMIRTLLLIMACCALSAGIAGYFRGSIPRRMSQILAPEMHQRFAADWWAHRASYASGFIGGVLLWIVVATQRFKRTRVSFVDN